MANVNVTMLVQEIKASKKRPVTLAAEWGMSLPTYYSRISGASEWTASNIVAATKSLGLTKAKRDAIFFEE